MNYARRVHPFLSFVLSFLSPRANPPATVRRGREDEKKKENDLWPLYAIIDPPPIFKPLFIRLMKWINRISAPSTSIENNGQYNQSRSKQIKAEKYSWDYYYNFYNFPLKSYSRIYIIYWIFKCPYLISRCYFTFQQYRDTIRYVTRVNNILVEQFLWPRST